MLQWGHAFVSVETTGARVGTILSLDVASMGPRFCKRGNAGSQPPDWLALYALQWGHAFVSVETRQRRHPATPRRLLQWGHAFVSVETMRTFVSHYHNANSFNGATLL